MGEPTNYVAYAIAGLVVILFGVLVGFSFKVWRVPHALLAIAVFLATGWFLVMSAQTLNTLGEWRTIANRYEAQIKTQHEQRVLLERGDPGDPESIAQSLEYHQKQVALSMIGRGLVWRGMQRGEAAEADGFVTVTLNTSLWGDESCISPPAQGQPGEGFAAEVVVEPADALPPKKHGIMPGMVLYVFLEQPASNLGLDLTDYCRVPQAYLGQFEVKESSEESPTILLASLLPREEIPPSMLDAIELGGPGISWTLYGSMPIDRHDLFAELSDDELRQLLPDETEEQYIRDFEPASEDDPTENVWVRVQFTEPHTLIVDAPAEGEAGLQPADQPGNFHYYDDQGQAIFPDVRHGGDGSISFDPGTEILLPLDAAQALLDENVVEQVEDEEGKKVYVYVRPLRHYPSLLAGYRMSTNRLKDLLATLEVDIQRQTQAVTQATAQLEVRENQRVLMEQDLAGFRSELEIVAALRDKLAADLQEIKTDSRRLYLSVKARAEQLTRTQLELLRQIESGEETSPADPSTPQPEQADGLATAEP